MEFAEVKNILLEERFIDNIISRDECQYAGKEYALVIRCDLLLSDRIVPVVIGIPSEWETMLFDFYVRDYESFPFIPHIGEKGKICLYDLEGVLIDTQFDGLLRQCFRRAADVLSDGLSGINKLDFIYEFDAYWQMIPDCDDVRFSVPEDKKSVKIYYGYKKRDKTKNAHRTYAEVKGAGVLRDWNIDGTLYRGSFIYIEAKDYVYPPDPRDANLKEYVNNLLRFANQHELNGLFKQGDKPFIIFEIRQPNGFSSFVGIYTISGQISDSDGYYQFDEKSVINPLKVIRNDKAFLMRRVENSANPLKNMKVLIIGAGSIGGYLASFLAKTGCERMTIVDYQIFTEENIYRHVLDKSYVDRYKVEALAKKIQSEVPLITINTRAERIETAFLEGAVDFTDFDVIFSVTGNHNINRWLNKNILQSGINVPVIYAWNEPLDIGYHTAVVRADLNGSFEDLFGRDDETGELIDVTAYCDHKQKVTKNMTGCEGSYIPYGSEISILSATAAIDLLKRYATGRVANNEVISYKGDGYFFRKAGLVATQVFNKQNEFIKRWSISELL